MTPAEQFALFKTLCPKYSELTGSGDLYRIALSVEPGKYSLSERFDAYEKYLILTGSPAAGIIDQSMRNLIVEYSETFK